MHRLSDWSSWVSKQQAASVFIGLVHQFPNYLLSNTEMASKFCWLRYEKNNSLQNNYLDKLLGLIVATFFISTSGVLGRYISMPSEVIIFFRATFAMIILFVFLKFKRVDFKLKSSKHRLPFLIGGVFMGVHWITYFYFEWRVFIWNMFI